MPISLCKRIRGYQTHFAHRKTILYWKKHCCKFWNHGKKTFPLYNQHIKTTLHSIITLTSCEQLFVQLWKCKMYCSRNAYAGLNLQNEQFLLTMWAKMYAFDAFYWWTPIELNSLVYPNRHLALLPTWTTKSQQSWVHRCENVLKCKRIRSPYFISKNQKVGASFLPRKKWLK